MFSGLSFACLVSGMHAPLGLGIGLFNHYIPSPAAEPGIGWLSHICAKTTHLIISLPIIMTISYYEDIVPFRLVTRDEIVQIFQEMT